MKKTTYWKDVWRTFVASKGRMLSIALLMALGSFALIGLKVTSPNMKKTGEHFFKTHQTADLSLISTYSINQTDQDLLNSIKKKNVDIEYGYFKDAVIKGKNTAFRIFSKPKKISTYDLIEGKLPTKDGEIALSSTYKEEYSVGDKINFSEPVDSSGQKQLKEQTYTITGFVNSSELLSRNRLGNASAGTGKLDGYAIVPETDFTSNDYMIARIRYKDLENVSPFSEEYANKILNERLNSRNSLKTNLRNASLKSSHSLKLKLLKLNKNLKQHSHRPSKWLQATQPKPLASKKLLPKLKPSKKNSKKVKQWLIIYQRLAINSTLVVRFRVLRDMLLMKVILTSFTM